MTHYLMLLRLFLLLCFIFNSYSSHSYSHSCSYSSGGMNIQIVSDLHIEFYDTNDLDWDSKGIIDPVCDTLALLGDIGVVTTPHSIAQYESFIRWCCDKFSNVLVLTGNHEYYNPDDHRTTMDEVDTIIERLADEIQQLTFMNKKSVIIEGVRIIGTTLWSAIPNAEAGNVVQNFLNDYQLIYLRSSSNSPQIQQLRAHHSHSLHEEQLQWLIESLQEASQEPAIPVVVLTHHTPSMSGTSNPRYENTPLPNGYRNCGFSSPLDDLFLNFPVIRCWCYGHTHYNNVQIIGNRTVLMSNQRGYKNHVNKDYISGLAITVAADVVEVPSKNIKLMCPVLLEK